MFQKRFLTFLFTALVFALSVAAVSAQNAPIRGTIKLQKADGTTAPVADVVVEAYRTDIGKGKASEAKTNKRGEFGFAGFPLGQKFALAISGPGIAPIVQPDIKPGMENVDLVVNEGDGRRLTEAEAREAIKGAAPAAAGGETEAQKKEREELLKKNADIEAKNKKIQADDDVARKANQEGRAALEAKNYDLAIAKFDEGITAVPDYVGSTPILLSGKIVALKNRGFDLYVQGAKSADAAAKQEKYNAAKKEWDAGLSAYKQAIDIIKKAEPATAANDQQLRRSVTRDLYLNTIEIHRLMAVAQVDTTRTADAEALIHDYIAVEEDPVKKTKMLQTLGDIMRSASEFDKAAAAYRSVLETAPDNTEVMASLGLTLVAQGFASTPQNRDQLQEGLNYMQKYADTVAILPTDPPNIQEFKKSVKDTVEYLKTEEKLKAQPTKSAPAKKKG